MKIVKIKSIKEITVPDKKEVFDVTMKSNPHTFFANNILVHNSCYFRIMEAEDIEQAEKIGAEVVKACDQGSIPMLVKNIFNGDDVMRSDFEAIARSTLSYGKKKQYAFLKAWEDGSILPSPKLGITGLSIKRSDSPKQLSTEMKPFFTDIMKGLKHNEIKEAMDRIEDDYDDLMLYDMAAKRTANNLGKYLIAFKHEIKYKERPFNIEKLDEYLEENFPNIKIKIDDSIYEKFMRVGSGVYRLDNNELLLDSNGDIEFKVKLRMVIPFHIKASILYNYLLQEYGISEQYPNILNGDKIKIFFIKPEKLNIKINVDDVKYDMIQQFDCIAFPSNSKNLPRFIEDFIPDKERMLETYFYGKMETVFDVIDFSKEAVENQEAMDSLF